jgi:hypothetical protein
VKSLIVTLQAAAVGEVGGVVIVAVVEAPSSTLRITSEVERRASKENT